jgi:hypothetical protein
MQTRREKTLELGLALAVGAAVFALFWVLGSPDNGWLGFVAAGLSVSVLGSCTVLGFARHGRREDA